MTDNPPPPYPLDLISRAALVLTPAAFRLLVEHCEEVNPHGYGEVRLVWHAGRIIRVVHETSDNV